jgi:hypothetical protein
VGVSVGVDVTSGVGERVGVGELVGVGIGVSVGMGVCVAVGVAVHAEAVMVAISVSDGPQLVRMIAAMNRNGRADFFIFPLEIANTYSHYIILLS